MGASRGSIDRDLSCCAPAKKAWVRGFGGVPDKVTSSACLVWARCLVGASYLDEVTRGRALSGRGDSRACLVWTR
jgi:hypothetical protein